MQNLEPYIFQYFVHTFAFLVQCEQRIEINKVLIFATAVSLDASLSLDAWLSVWNGL